MLRSRVARPEFTSMATRASVGLMTIEPPDFSVTWGTYILSNCSSTWWWRNRGTWSVYCLTRLAWLGTNIFMMAFAAL